MSDTIAFLLETETGSDIEGESLVCVDGWGLIAMGTGAGSWIAPGAVVTAGAAAGAGAFSSTNLALGLSSDHACG